jgi:hypothetical protein
LGGSVYTIKKSKKALVVASKEIRLQVTVDKTKYMVMSQDQNAGRSHNMKNENQFFERVNSKILGNNPNESKFYSGKNYEQTKVTDCLLSCGAVSLVFQFAIQKCND